MIFDHLNIFQILIYIFSFSIIGKGIEAIDLPSLLEKFEELENAYFCNPKQNLCNKSPTKDIPTSSRKSRNKTTKTNKQRTYRNKESKKALRQASKHKVIQEKLQEKFAELTQVIISINGVLL